VWSSGGGASAPPDGCRLQAKRPRLAADEVGACADVPLPGRPAGARVPHRALHVRRPHLARRRMSRGAAAGRSGGPGEVPRPVGRVEGPTYALRRGGTGPALPGILRASLVGWCRYLHRAGARAAHYPPPNPADPRPVPRGRAASSRSHVLAGVAAGVERALTSIFAARRPGASNQGPGRARPPGSATDRRREAAARARGPAAVRTNLGRRTCGRARGDRCAQAGGVGACRRCAPRVRATSPGQPVPGAGGGSPTTRCFARSGEERPERSWSSWYRQALWRGTARGRDRGRRAVTGPPLAGRLREGGGPGHV